MRKNKHKPSNKPKLIITRQDGKTVEVEPIKMWQPDDVGILMPNGSIASPDDKPKCKRCKTPVEWKHLDELGELNLELYGVLCWKCLAEAQRNTAENGY